MGCEVLFVVGQKDGVALFGYFRYGFEIYEVTLYALLLEVLDPGIYDRATSAVLGGGFDEGGALEAS